MEGDAMDNFADALRRLVQEYEDRMPVSEIVATLRDEAESLLDAAKESSDE
jgi:hypothetical protein